MKKQLLLCVIALLGMCYGAKAAEASSYSWSNLCSGKMEASWYGSAEAQAIADVVIEVQRTNGGWTKNEEIHKLTTEDISRLIGNRSDRSCLDNAATTQEMRFLAKVYQGCKVEKYRDSFVKGLNMIFAAEKQGGGWSQYLPLSGSDSYQDYITFNDDLMINVLKLLRDISNNKGDFADIVDEATRARCTASFDKGIEVILKCQIDDNGTKSAWCAQHDPDDFLPTEGRPHELPSVSGYESASLLSFLMSIEKPSSEVQAAIIAAVQWLDAHKIEGKAIEDYTNDKGEGDRRIIDKANSAIWGRFIQLGGESGKKVYNKLFQKLKDRNKSRSYSYNGKTYTYTEYEIATSSYREDKAYQPVFGIYSNDYAHLFYRFLYNYADTDPVVDSKGLPIATSLMSGNRRSYQYLGSWCQNVINTEYPAWKQKIDAQAEAGGETTIYELSAGNKISEEAGDVWIFDNGFKVSNEKAKGYGAGAKGTNTVKYSANVDYTITIPENLSVQKVMFYGYDNYDVDAYISKLNGVTYSSTDYVFPAKIGDPVSVSHTITLEAPVTGSLVFSLGSKQCCIVLSLYCTDVATGIEETVVVKPNATVKRIQNGQIVIVKDGKTYNMAGQIINQ